MQEEGTSLEQLEEELKDKMKKLYLPQPDEKQGLFLSLTDTDLKNRSFCV